MRSLLLLTLLGPLVVGAYHLDGQTHGATLGPDGTAVEQFGFIFKRTP